MQQPTCHLSIYLPHHPYSTCLSTRSHRPLLKLVLPPEQLPEALADFKSQLFFAYSLQEVEALKMLDSQLWLRCSYMDFLTIHTQILKATAYLEIDAYQRMSGSLQAEVIRRLQKHHKRLQRYPIMGVDLWQVDPYQAYLELIKLKELGWKVRQGMEMVASDGSNVHYVYFCFEREEN